MRATLLAILVALGSPGPAHGQEKEPLDALRALLAAPGRRGVLYRIGNAERDIQRWVMADDGGGREIDRPAPAIPHREVALERLVPLVEASRIQAREVDLADHSWLLEVVDGGRVIARLDLHTLDGPASIFVSDHAESTFPEGWAQFALTAEGRRDWIEALESIWAAAGDQ